MTKGFIVGPFTTDHQFNFGKLLIAPFFTLPKPDGSRRPIVHLSWDDHGNKYSVNDIVDEAFKPVKYITLKELVALCKAAGPGGYIFIVDMQDAYYRVPIHPSHYKYNGLKWLSHYWVFTSLQMGLASSAQIYTDFADAVEWMVVKRNKHLMFETSVQALRHYLDDFFGACRSKKTANIIYQDLIYLVNYLGIPTRLDKCKPPNNIYQKILGWGIKQSKQKICLPEDKRVDYLQEVQLILKDKQASKKFIHHVRGRLGNVAQIKFPGKAFLRRLDAVLYLPKFKDSETIRMSSFVLEDLRWWESVLQNPTNVEVDFDYILKSPDAADFEIYTDATTEIGFGGHLDSIWFQVRWEDTIIDKIEGVRGPLDITIRELLIPLVAAELFKTKLHNKAVTIYNDNPGAASAIATAAPPLYRLDMHCLIIHLASLAVEHNFLYWGTHVIAKSNHNMNLADGLSRFNPDTQAIFQDKFTCVNQQAITITNKLLLKLLQAPLNLPSKYDIELDIRKEFNILLNEKFYQNTKMRTNDILDQFYKYNILKD